MLRAMRRLSVVGLVFAGASALALFAMSASAGPPGKWTQITHAHNGARSNLGLARGKDGRLHVLWAGPNRAPFPAIFDTTISRNGVVGKPTAVISGWAGVHTPTAVTAADGSIHAVISGQKVNSANDPLAGLNEAVGPGTWKLGGRAFGNSPITVASNADIHSAFLKNGQLVSVWGSAASLLFQVGIDPGTAPQNITPPGDPAASPVIAVDQTNGEAIIAYHGVGSGKCFFRRIQPSLGAPTVFPQAKVDSPSIAARAGGGVYTAYTPDGERVWLVHYGGGKPKLVPVPRGARVLTAGLAAAPEGRFWVFYGDEQQTYVTRTSKRVSGFEPVQTLKSPPKTIQYFRLEGEGSVGPLDLFADITVDGQTKDGSYHQQVRPALSLRARKATLKSGAVRITVRVTDAGDAVQGATVTGLPGGPKRTSASGSVIVTVPGSASGALALTGKKAGYVAAKGRLTI
jgi:hypothetical protein